MPAPQAPMPLYAQLKSGSNIVITLPLRNIGAAPLLADNGGVFNVGDPTATYTFTIPAGGSDGNISDLIGYIERLAREGTFTVT